MKDKAGVEITVGCRVLEADFDYGDGTVESIEVPSAGGGFNVGVLWDDPAKEGPGWSAEGGGRGANHLLRMRINGDPKVGAQKTPRAVRNRKTNFFIVKFPTHGLLWHRSNDASRTKSAREEGEAAMTVARSAPSSHSWHERDDGEERVILICDGLWVRDAF